MPPLYVITRPEDHPGTGTLVLQLGDGRLPLRKGESSAPRRLSEWDIKEVGKLRGFILETEDQFKARTAPPEPVSKSPAKPIPIPDAFAGAPGSKE